MASVLFPATRFVEDGGLGPEAGNVMGRRTDRLDIDIADDEFVAGLMGLILELRADVRREKNWAAADKIRDRLKELNVTVEDVKDGPARWSRS